MTPVTFAYIDEPPFVSPAPEGGWPRGCDAEVAATVLKRLGVRSPRAVAVSFADLLPGVAAGRWTFNTALFMTEERRKQVRFSRPVWALADGLLVRAADRGRFATYEDIAADEAARLAVVAGQVQAETALKASVPMARVLAFDGPEEAVRALREKRADAYASVAFAHRGLLARRPDPALAISDLAAPEHRGRAGSTPAYGAYSFSTRNDASADAFDEALAEFLGGAEHAAIMAGHGFTVRNGIAWG